MNKDRSELKKKANPDYIDTSGFERKNYQAIGMGLDGKIAIVTGAGRGIGRAICHQLAKAGANICLTSDMPEELERTRKECVAFGAKAIVVTADVTERSQVRQVVDTCVRELGEPFILVLNQGMQKAVPCLEISREFWDKMWAVNVTGSLFFIQEAGKYMIQREKTQRVRGKIIFISSITGLRGGRGVNLLPYHVTKGAVCSLTRALSQEWAKYDINVNSIAPGTFLTALSSWTGDPEKEKKFLSGHIPMAHFKEKAIVPEKEPELIATMALYLAAPASDYTTGQIVAIDGGTVEHFI